MRLFFISVAIAAEVYVVLSLFGLVPLPHAGR